MRYFDNGNKMSMDVCAIKARDIENESLMNYSIFNTFNDCQMLQNASELAVEYPNLRYNIGYGIDCGIIDADSKIKLDQKLRAVENQQLCTRTFTAVPNLGRGILVPNLETQLIQGIDTSLNKDCHNLAEYELGHHAPLTDCMHQYIKNASVVMDEHAIGKPSKDIFMQQRKNQKKNC
jgi:hypothetical protein